MNSLQTIIEQAWETELCYKKRQQQKPLEGNRIVRRR
jgi:hypothetical protein